jgi:glycosyltransferase involved in cell wall biosynthesis
MKIVIIPFAKNSSNPYLKQLIEALELSETKVQTASGRSLFALWRAVLRSGWPDLVHLQWQHVFFQDQNRLRAGGRTVLFFIQWATLRWLGLRFVWTVHNLVDHEQKQAVWELRACRWLAQAVDRLIVHCPAAVETVSAAYQVPPIKIRVVPHGHYIHGYPPPLPKAEARQRLGLPVQGRVFLFCGRIRAYKGVARLLAAFAALNANDVRLLIVGAPTPAALGQALSAQAATDPRVVTHLEFISIEDLVIYLSACDLVVLPYRESLTSGAAVLAASYSRPVLMPRLGCMAAFPAESVILYDPARPGSLREALAEAFAAPLDKMGLTAKDYIKQFSWPVVAAETLLVYRSTLTQATQPAFTPVRRQ